MADQSLVPGAGDFLIKGSGGAVEFINSNLDPGLKDKGIKTVIPTSTSAQGVEGTNNGAAQRGYQGGRAGRRHVGPEDAFSELYRPGTSTRAAPPRWSTMRPSRAAI